MSDEQAMRLEDGPGGTRILRGEGHEIASFHLRDSKTSARNYRIQGVVLHYTAIKASNRPASDLKKFEKFLLPEEVETVTAYVADKGRIPSGLSLSLQSARSTAQTSWDFLVGDEGLVVQSNLHPDRRLTWHAGRRKSWYEKKKDLHHVDPWTGQKVLVWDSKAKKFRHPALPDGQVPTSGNYRFLGIEIESYGRVHRIEDQYYRKVWDSKNKQWKYISVGLQSHQVAEHRGALYEEITDEAWRSLLALCGALRDAYDLPPSAWYSHREIVPDRRVDPEPPLRIASLVTELYPDLELPMVASFSDEPDLESRALTEDRPAPTKDEILDLDLDEVDGELGLDLGDYDENDQGDEEEEAFGPA